MLALLSGFLFVSSVDAVANGILLLVMFNFVPES